MGIPAGLADGFFTQSRAPVGETLFSSRRNPNMGAWRVTRGNVALHVGTVAMPIRNANAVDLNGNQAGTISQLVVTVPGTQYTVRFSATGNWRTNPDQPRFLTVGFGDSTAPFTIQPGAAANALGWQTLSATFTATATTTNLQFISNDTGKTDGAFITGVELIDVAAAPVLPPALNTIAIPMPANLADFVANNEKAILLGKALFWDMQVGSDGVTACASCHWNAGADVRTTNQLNPGAPGSAFGPNGNRQATLAQNGVAAFRGANGTLTAADFPFHLPTNPAIPGDEPGFPVGNPILRSTMEVAGSQGVVNSAGAGIAPGVAAEAATVIPSRVHTFGGVNTRATTGRNTPTNINAVFFDRLFWDGRARNKFNGVNPFGDMDPNARVLQIDAAGRLRSVRISLSNSALASQAVGPVLSDVEMSWTGREFAQVAQKLFSLTPLAQQQVVNFYVRGADFFHTNIEDLDPNVDGIPSLSSDPEGISGLVEFMKALTDERVRNQSAPFDHPELLLPLGHGGDSSADIVIDDFISVAATGRNGGQPAQTFAEALIDRIHPAVADSEVLAALAPAVVGEQQEGAAADVAAAADAELEETAAEETAPYGQVNMPPRGRVPARGKRTSATERLLDYKNGLSQDAGPVSGNAGEGPSDVLSALARKNADTKGLQSVDPRSGKPAGYSRNPAEDDAHAGEVDAAPEDGNEPVADGQYDTAPGLRFPSDHRPQSATSRLLDYKNGLADDVTSVSGNGDGEVDTLSALADKNDAAEDVTAMDPRNRKRGYGQDAAADAGHGAAHGDRRDSIPVGPGYRAESVTSRLLDYKNGLADDITAVSGDDLGSDVLSALEEKNDNAEQADQVSLDLKRKGSYSRGTQSSPVTCFVGGWLTTESDDHEQDED